MLLFIIYVVLSSSGLILFKLGSSSLTLQVQNSIFSMNVSLTTILGMLCYMISFILWMVIIGKSEVSYIVPLGVACTNIAILLGSYFILNETITTNVIIGAVLIIAGVILISR
ncbi:hypothetical protein [Candidatus Enterococcus clewellii]|uniref:EamA domain-containing protein n=1 Tax=Candidatus Enterococcus clewellii TaxID=1834193 RepID=A0A242K2Q9_9ENTE|nr:hypothetical protein [Enterococcus sp. 9E7_DIV0242]OTP12871.1 hypothetical protein A5888_003452 [Enterococcus sp. 9E7_DIV0242]